MDGFINEYFSSDSEKRPIYARKLAERIKGSSILALVKALHSQLTGSDEQTRADATECLVDVIKVVGVNPDQRGVLWTFFCNRLADGKSFTAAIHGLETIPGGDLSELMSAMNEANFRNQPQKSRYYAFRFLRQLVSDPQAADLFIEMASGEKDPQNLLLTLDMAAILLKSNNINTEKREDIFESTFCYFPVTFKPSKDMPYTVDVEDIKHRLRVVLSSPCIAEFVVPALISKLNAVNPDIKADVLLTLKTVVRSYPEPILNEYWLPIWESLKFEILHGSPENPSNEAIFEILQALLPIPDFITAVAQEAGKIDTTKRALAVQTCVLVTGIANSQKVLEKVATPVLEILFLDQQVGNIEFVNILILSKFALPQAYNDQILSLMLSGLSSQDYYPLATAGVTPLVLHVPAFAPVVVQALSQHIPDSKAIAAIGVVARIDPNVVLTECISKLFSRMEDTFNNDTKQALQIIGSLSVAKEIVNAVTIRLCARAENIDDRHYLFEILTTIYTGIQSVELKDLSRYYKVIFPMLPLFFNPSPKQAFLSDIAIYRMSMIMEITVRAIPQPQQAEYAEEICRLIWPGNSSVFGRNPSPLAYLMSGCLVGIDERNLPTRFQIGVLQYTDVLKRTHDVFQRAGYLRYLAVAVNKWPLQFGDIPLALKWLTTSIETGQDTISNLEVFSWLCKGLLMRNDQLGFEGAEYITKVITTSPLGQYAARVFGVLIADDRILSKENGLTVRALYKQRLFLQALPQLLEGFNSPNQETKLNSTTAISTLVRFTPLKVLQDHFDDVIPVVVECLDVNLDSSLQNGALVTISSTITQPGAIVLYEKNLDKIVSSTLTLVTKSSDPQTRANAIEVLYLAAKHLPRSSIKPYAPLVLGKLPLALSDNRRDVRKQASRAIQIYHVL